MTGIRPGGMGLSSRPRHLIERKESSIAMDSQVAGFLISKTLFERFVSQYPVHPTRTLGAQGESEKEKEAENEHVLPCRLQHLQGLQGRAQAKRVR